MSNEMNNEQRIDEECKLLKIFGNFPDGMMITESLMAKIFDRHPITIKRAVKRGELPPSVKIMGEQTWIVGDIRKHVEKKMEEAKRMQQAEAKRIASLMS